jgi:Ca2+-binding EF-hand superfamily protein
MLTFLGYQVSDSDLKELINTVDTDKSGEIDESEFFRRHADLHPEHGEKVPRGIQGVR